MWTISEEGGCLTAVHSKSTTGTWLLAVGAILVAAIWFAPQSFWMELALKDARGLPSPSLDAQRAVLSVVPLGVVLLGFLLSGIETRLVRDTIKNVLKYRYSYGFGTTKRDIPLDQVVGFLVIKTYIEIYERTAYGEIKVGDRIDGSLDLVLAGELRVPLITRGQEEAVRAGAAQLRDAFELELLERTERKREVRVFRSRRGRMGMRM